jgi:hypothetical protein
MYQEIEDNVTPPPATNKRKRGATSPKSTAKKPKAVYYGNKQQGKPMPHGQPPVWSDKRQGLCEALPYYRAYQSGAYTHGGRVLGFMCDGEVGDRDVFGDQIMIARV